MATLLPQNIDAAPALAPDAASVVSPHAMDVAVTLPALEQATPGPVPSDSQREAIEAGAHPLLVLAGPGAGKTFCLIERIRYLIERLGFDPSRICAFTFTNKAAGVIAHRLESRLGPQGGARRITRGTIHAFCATLLRDYGEDI